MCIVDKYNWIVLNGSLLLFIMGLIVINLIFLLKTKVHYLVERKGLKNTVIIEILFFVSIGMFIVALANLLFARSLDTFLIIEQIILVPLSLGINILTLVFNISI